MAIGKVGRVIDITPLLSAVETALLEESIEKKEKGIFNIFRSPFGSQGKVIKIFKEQYPTLYKHSSKQSLRYAGAFRIPKPIIFKGKEVVI